MEEIVAPANHAILVIGPHVWGKGPNLPEALRQARKVGPVKRGGYEAYVAPLDVEVNNMGYFSKHRDCPECKQVVSVKQK